MSSVNHERFRMAFTGLLPISAFKSQAEWNRVNYASAALIAAGAFSIFRQKKGNEYVYKDS